VTAAVIELVVSDPPLNHFVSCAALLLDMDGTLLDSAACVEQTWRAWCARHRLIAEDVLQVSHGRQNEETIRMVAPHLLTADELSALAQAQENCRDGIIPVRGASRLLDELPAECWAIVTSAWRRLAEIRLTCAGLPLPTVLVTADETRRGKPAPEGYLRAANRLGVEPTACVVVEDAPAGVAAARAAGMRVIGITTALERAHLGSDWHITDLACLTVRQRAKNPPPDRRLTGAASPQQAARARESPGRSATSSEHGTNT
jgi:sugar-phosphatase